MISFCTEMNENLFSITDSHKYNMNFHQFHLISETSMNKEIAGESVEEIKVKSPVIAFTFQIYLYRLLGI